MQIERSRYLNAKLYQHSHERLGHANSYKPKPVRTRGVEATFDIPQVREIGFYPQVLEKGGECTVLGVFSFLSEAETHWRYFLSGRVKRVLQGSQLVVIDNHAGLKAARKSIFMGTHTSSAVNFIFSKIMDSIYHMWACVER